MDLVVKGERELQRALKRYQRQIPFALSRALNDTAFGIRSRVQEEMRQRFEGGATPYALRAMRVEKSSKRRLVAVVGLRDDSPGKGTPYRQALGHMFTGGRRRHKRMEGAFMRLGVLPQGYSMVPASGAPLNAYGNVPGSFIVRLLSYFHAFGEQGYRANMTAKTRARIERQGRLKKAEGGYRTIRGKVYFISRGPGLWFGKRQHLPAGIWAKTGIHGVKVEPVFLFVRDGRYRQRIDLNRLGAEVMAEKLYPAFAKHFWDAVRTAR